MAKVASSIRHEWATMSQTELRDAMRGLHSTQDFATFLGVQPFQIAYYAYRIDKADAYTTFAIRRRNGRSRRIEAPGRTLKYIQRLIHESLTRVYGPHPAVHGFRSERSILTNAQRHTGRRYVLNIDLADFFPSITRKRIFGRLKASPYGFDSIVANLIAALTTNVYRRLLQGSPSSPVVANIVAAELDNDLADLCGRLRCRYTRYADDITISTSRRELSPELARYPNAIDAGQVIIGDGLRDVIEKHGFLINDRKSRLQSYWTRQVCTGLVVNTERITPPRSYIRHLRALVDQWKRNGWEHAAQVLHTKENRGLLDNRRRLMDHVLGRIAYLRMVRGTDDPVSGRLDQIVRTIPEAH